MAMTRSVDVQRMMTAVMVLLMSWQTSIAADSCNCPAITNPLSVLQWEDRDWVLAFRLTANVQQSAYDTYVSSRNDDLPINRAFLLPGCLQPNGPCNTHYRSGLLDMWAYAGIDKVKVSIYKGGIRRAFIIFNGRNTDFMSWFSKDNVLESSWNNFAQETFNYFSIPGHKRVDGVTTMHLRRFYIFRSYAGCADDYGWLSVGDQGYDICSWGTSSQSFPFPTIYFSRGNTFGHFGTSDVETADVMTISVKFISRTRP